MKNIKKLLVLAVVLVLVLTSVLALAACEETHKCKHVCPVEGCGKCLDKDCKDPACADKCPGHDTPAPHVCKHVCPVDGCGKCLDKDCKDPVCAEKCPGHDTPAPHVCKHVCPVEGCGKCLDKDCKDPVCAEKCLGHESGTEFTVTLNAGEGKFEEGAKTTFKTVNGGFGFAEDEFLPEPTVDKAHWHFDNWYDAQIGGNAIDEQTAVFDKDTVLYARFIRDNGIWVGDVFKAGLVKNNGASLTGGLKAEYWIGGSKITLAKGDVIKVYMDGIQLSFFVLGSSAGIENVSTTTKQDSVTVSVAGEFEFYVKDYTSAGDPGNWVCQFAGPSEVIAGSEIPAGCAPIHLTWGDGSFEITFFIRLQTDSVPIGADKIGDFSIYTFNGTGGELFGNWNTSATAGKCALEMTSAKSGMPAGWIFRRSQQQTQDINGLENGGVYLVDFTPNSHGKTVITKLTIASTNVVTLDMGYEGQPETKATTKSYNGKLTYTPLASREGYDFAGWFDAAEGGNAITLETPFTTDKTIYARWTKAIEVTLDENYAEQPAEKAVAYAYGGKLTSLPTPVREDYDFMGWFDAAEGGNAVTNDTVYTANATIYAQWKLKIVVTVDQNYTGKPENTTQKANHGKLSPLPQVPATRNAGTEEAPELWYCDGWFTEAEGGTKVTTSTVFTENTTIYAHWRLAYKVTFDLNYEGSADPQILTANSGNGNKFTSDVYPATPEREGYEFLGWYTDPEAGTSINVYTTYTKDTVVYARWRVPFVITFDLNYEGQPEEKETLTASQGKLAALPEDPVREGFKFLGWYTAAEGGSKITTRKTYSADTTVYAHWEEITEEA